MVDRLRVRTLVEAGHSQEQAAHLVGVSLSSVQRILREPPIESAPCGPSPRSRRVGRPSKVAAFRSLAAEILEAEPSLPSVEVLHRLRCAGYDGGKSAVYSLVRRLRPCRACPPMVRFEGLAGEFSQHDFGSVTVTYVDGSKERLRFFVSRLKYSRWSDVRLVPDEKVEALVRALLAAFEAWGGVPLPCRCARSSTIPRRSCWAAGTAASSGTRRSPRPSWTTASGSSCARRVERTRRARWRTSSGGSRAASSRSGASTTARTPWGSSPSGSSRSTPAGRAGRPARCRPSAARPRPSA